MNTNRSVILRLLPFLTALCLLAEILKMILLNEKEVWSTDYQSYYLTGKLLLSGRAIYSVGNEIIIFHQLVPRISGIGHVLAADAPLTFVLTIPFVLLPYRVGYFVRGAFELVAALVGIGFALRHWRTPSSIGIAVVLGASPPMCQMLLMTQNDGMLALGVGLFLLLARHRRPFWSGVVMGVTAGITLPNVFFGVLVFILAYRCLPMVKGAVLGGIIVAGLSVLSVGVVNIRGFLSAVFIVQTDTFSPPLRSLIDGVLPPWAGVAVLVVIIAAVNIVLGLRARGRRMELYLLSSFALSILLNPHYFVQDLVLALPVAACVIEIWWTALRRYTKSIVLVTILCYGLTLEFPNPSAIGVASIYIVTIAAVLASAYLILGNVRIDPLQPSAQHIE